VMEQFEKVCKGLECCILRDPDDHQRCGECPYNPHAISNEPCANGLKYNALALIRQQQERIKELEAGQTVIADCADDKKAVECLKAVQIINKYLDEEEARCGCTEWIDKKGYSFQTDIGYFFEGLDSLEGCLIKRLRKATIPGTVPLQEPPKDVKCE